MILRSMKSKRKKQKNGFPQGSVLASILFNIYMNDQTIRYFIYADDTAIEIHYNNFEVVETKLESLLKTMTT